MSNDIISRDRTIGHYPITIFIEYRTTLSKYTIGQLDTVVLLIYVSRQWL